MISVYYIKLIIPNKAINIINATQDKFLCLLLPDQIKFFDFRGQLCRLIKETAGISLLTQWICAANPYTEYLFSLKI